jgi:hypothetical protein
MKKRIIKGFTVAVETGSCSPDYLRWEEADNCGHYHRTVEAAMKCREKLQVWYCNHGKIAGTPCKGCHGRAQSNSTSAHWYNARIHNENGERV